MGKNSDICTFKIVHYINCSELSRRFSVKTQAVHILHRRAHVPRTYLVQSTYKAKHCYGFMIFGYLVFHIITSCCSLWVKELMIQLWAPVWKRRTKHLRRLGVQTGDLMLGKVMRPPLLFLTLLPAAHPDLMHLLSTLSSYMMTYMLQF